VKAQVRIGGNGAPQGAAVLDLNADNTATPTANKGALALPRVSLASTTAQLNGTAPITGMLVYNTNAAMTNGTGVGMYFFDGNSWVRVAPIHIAQTYATIWILYYDDSVTFAATSANSYRNFAVSGLLWSDVCMCSSRQFSVTPTDGSVEYGGTYGEATTTEKCRLACYRPTRL